MIIMAEKKAEGKKKEEKDVNVDIAGKKDKKNNKNETQSTKAETKTEAKETKKEAAPKKAKGREKKDKPAKQERKVIIDKNMDPFETIHFVMMTEKCVRLIEPQNKLVFVVRRESDKKQIRKAVENAFQTPVSGLTTMIDQKGRKRAFVKFSQAGIAGEIAIRLGII